uniref:NADH dehydrogenase subunit 5 n=1 Tax=Coptosoma variegatum TaxID=2968960 RepID=UPI0022371DBF|nr:NADH dehydrogenase subunit 5 [Coptosoma variegatum]UYA97857.1 NADH dehydrogenase subunit 5 [Coptosoma variegatum]
MFKICSYKFWGASLLTFGLLFNFWGLCFVLDNYSLFLDWEFYSLNSVMFTFTLYLDYMSFIFMGSVLIISSMVVFYSSSYMSLDIFMIRFLMLVVLFIISMMFLIVSPNLVSILLGWDGLGLVSYCLVIYFQNYKSYNAGMVTVLINRIGDVAILVCIAWLFNCGGFNYYFSFIYEDVFLHWLFIFIVLASFTKSAQIPFSSWLPAAMAAPTPVSALVHSSTLVTAGVYLLIRFNSLLESFDLSILLFISCLTMFMAGLGANFEYDLKKIIALSTLSQLGLMMSILFLGEIHMAYFHLLSHAFFKALLFLCAGLIIHSMNGSQDIRHMGFLSGHLPFTCSCFCISNFSLCGFPFLSGFYSKDLVLDYSTFEGFNLFIYLMFFLSVGLTASYSFRLIYYCVGSYNGLSPCESFFEDPWMSLSMVLLTFFSIFFGSVFNWLFLPYTNLMILPLECKLMPVIVVLLGSWLGYELSLMWLFDMSVGIFYPLLFNFLGSMWFMPTFFNPMSMSFLSLSHKYTLSLDGGWCEYIISKSPLLFFTYLGERLSLFHFSNVKLNLMAFFFWTLFFFFLNQM